MQIKKSYSKSNTQYWCHFCQISFASELKAGKDVILCPKCNNDFCEMKNRFNHPEKFKPYQKKPQKKEKNIKRIDKQALKMTVNQLAQLLQIRQSQNFEVTEQMLIKIRKTIEQPSQCSVCRMDLQKGQQGIVPHCKHTFHEQCLLEWIKRKNTCPTCRRKIIEQSFQKLL